MAELKYTQKEQDKIWDFFQNEQGSSFDGANGRYEFLLKHILGNQKVLNVGVGNGGLEVKAYAQKIDIYALDPNEKSISNLLNQIPLKDKAKVGYSQEMPFVDNFFDAVIMSEVLEHLDNDAFNKTIAEVARVLKPKGRFIGTIPFQEKLDEQIVKCPKCGEEFHRWGHQQYFTIESTKGFLAPFFICQRVESKFFTEWDSVNIFGKAKALAKKFLSQVKIGTYGKLRNIFFVAIKN